MISVQNLLQRLSGNKRGILWLCLAIVLGFSSCSRKIFTGKDNKKEREKDTEVVTEPEVEEDKGPFKREAPVVSLLLPFRLQEVEPSSAGSLASFRRSELALDFYQGFKMGLDSLSAMGASFKLQVYDTRDQNTAISRVMMKPELAESSLIVGPVFPGGMDIVGRYARSHEIYFVSPLLPRVAVEGNPYQIVATAPVEMHAAKAAEFVAEDLRPSSVLVISTANADESKYIRAFMTEMRTQGSSVSAREIDVGSYGSDISGLDDFLHSGLNVLVVPSQSSTFWKILFSYLDSKGDSRRFAIIAHPDFPQLENIDLRKAEKYQVYFTSSEGDDPAPSTEFYRFYRREFGVPPSAYAAKGFDLAMYFGAALWNESEELPESIRKQYLGYRNEFDFLETSDGYVNKGVHLMKVEDYEYKEMK